MIEAHETHEGQVIRLVVDSRSDSSYVFYCCLRSRPIDPNVFYIMSDLTIAGPEKQILVRDAWLQLQSVNVNTIRGARLRGGWAAGHLGPWQHQQHFRLEGPRDPPAASRQPPAASRCCRSRNPWRRSRLLLRAAVRAWKSAWRRAVPGVQIWWFACVHQHQHQQQPCQ